MSHYQYGYFCPSFATLLYSPLLPADPQGYIPNRHGAAVCRFELDTCEGVYRSTSLMSSSQLLQQMSGCIILIIFVIGSWWPYSCCFVGCYFQDSFTIARSILVQLPSSSFSKRLLSVHVVRPYSSIDTTAAWKKLCSILSVRSDFHMNYILSLAVPAVASRVSMSVTVDKTLPPR